MLEVEGRHDGRAILLPVLIFAPAPSTISVQGSALLDTGATISGITGTVAEQLGLAGLGKRPLGSARGQAQVERYVFRIGLSPKQGDADPPRLPYVFEEVIGFELTNNFRFEALLGMDVLSQCDLILSRSGHYRLRFD